jgi:hypothetical protein
MRGMVSASQTRARWANVATDSGVCADAVLVTTAFGESRQPRGRAARVDAYDAFRESYWHEMIMTLPLVLSRCCQGLVFVLAFERPVELSLDGRQISTAVEDVQPPRGLVRVNCSTTLSAP